MKCTTFETWRAVRVYSESKKKLLSLLKGSKNKQLNLLFASTLRYNKLDDDLEDDSIWATLISFLG